MRGINHNYFKRTYLKQKAVKAGCGGIGSCNPHNRLDGDKLFTQPDSTLIATKLRLRYKTIRELQRVFEKVLK